MAVSRRQFLIGAGLAAAATGGLTACGSDSGSGGGEGGGTNMAFAWWGNAVRNANTDKSIAAYMSANPGVTISGQPGEFASYWDKLATQTAGNTAPDIIQMDMAYIAEYGTRGALLDLEANGADVSKFAEGTVDSGKIDGKLVGINAGINSLCILAAADVFEKAKMDLPDDKTWTWDSMKDTSAEVGAKANVIGLVGLFPTDGSLSTYLRQHGKELFVPDGLAFDAADAQGWFDLLVEYQKAKAIGTPENVSEEAAKPLDQSGLALSKAAMQLSNSNQLEAFTAAAGKELVILRLPSETGNAVDRKAWYKASQLFSASSRTKYPEAAVSFINWMVNSPEAANINLAERGIPANKDMLALIEPKLSKEQQAVSKYIVETKKDITTATPIAPPPGGGTLSAVLLRYCTDVLFGRMSTSEAATKFVDEMKGNLQV